jgi:hypothetical protein
MRPLLHVADSLFPTRQRDHGIGYSSVSHNHPVWVDRGCGIMPHARVPHHFQTSPPRRELFAHLPALRPLAALKALTVVIDGDGVAQFDDAEVCTAEELLPALPPGVQKVRQCSMGLAPLCMCVPYRTGALDTKFLYFIVGRIRISNFERYTGYFGHVSHTTRTIMRVCIMHIIQQCTVESHCLRADQPN